METKNTTKQNDQIELTPEEIKIYLKLHKQYGDDFLKVIDDYLDDSDFSEFERRYKELGQLEEGLKLTSEEIEVYFKLYEEFGENCLSIVSKYIDSKELAKYSNYKEKAEDYDKLVEESKALKQYVKSLEEQNKLKISDSDFSDFEDLRDTFKRYMDSNYDTMTENMTSKLSEITEKSLKEGIDNKLGLNTESVETLKVIKEHLTEKEKKTEEELNKSKAMISKATGVIENYKEQLSNLKETNKEIQEKNNSLLMVNASLEEKNSNLKSMNKGYETKNEKLQQQIFKLQEEYSDLKSDNKFFQEKIKDLETKFSEDIIIAKEEKLKEIKTLSFFKKIAFLFSK